MHNCNCLLTDLPVFTPLFLNSLYPHRNHNASAKIQLDHVTSPLKTLAKLAVDHKVQSSSYYISKAWPNLELAISLKSSPTTLSLLSSTASILAYFLLLQQPRCSHLRVFVPTTWSYLLFHDSFFPFLLISSQISLIKATFPDSDCCCCLVTKSCLTLCNPMDYSQPGSSVHGISQTRILECVAIPFSRGSSQPRNGTRVSCLAGGFLPLSHMGNWLSTIL